MGYFNGLNVSFEEKPGRLLTSRKMAKEKSTLISDRGRIARHIIPLFGWMTVKWVKRNDIERLMHDLATAKTAGMDETKTRGLSVMRGGRGVAGRTVALLGPFLTTLCATAFGRGPATATAGR